MSSKKIHLFWIFLNYINISYMILRIELNWIMSWTWSKQFRCSFNIILFHLLIKCSFWQIKVGCIWFFVWLILFFAMVFDSTLIRFSKTWQRKYVILNPSIWFKYYIINPLLHFVIKILELNHSYTLFQVTGSKKITM